MPHTVGAVAELSGVTVRTLHHYDTVGLLSPSGRSPAGYRLYDACDLERLQHIRYYRELDFSLEEIADILADPRGDREAHLRRQHGLLTQRIARLQEMVQMIEFTMEAGKMAVELTPQERFEVFGDHEDHTEEAQRRWGDTEAYRESARRTAGYTEDDWRRSQAESADWARRLGAVLDAGKAAEGPEARELAEEHREHISRWSYTCSYEIHTGLADLYLADPRFTAYYEKLKPGLARYLHDAIHANAVEQV
ncbi:MerR family transcriptional regulator [Streptomyces jumonjinensis]|uniref:MerR family transcriptional regulator n=1 Tax=Streptomyces jumonjinensis TaxID=1945 RepID=UPI003791311E